MSGESRWNFGRFAVAAVSALAAAGAAGWLYFAQSNPPVPIAKERDLGRAHALPAPGTTTLPEYEAKLFAFLNAREYVKLGWVRDKGVRDTGPFIDGTYYGTHPAVRIYYSPGVIRWLQDGRKGPVPDG